MNNQKMPAKSAAWWQPAMVLFVELGGWIAAPIIGAMFIGTWLDEKYDTEPMLYFASVAVAFIISTIGIVKTAIKAMNDMTAAENQEKLDKNKEANSSQNEQSE